MPRVFTETCDVNPLHSGIHTPLCSSLITNGLPYKIKLTTQMLASKFIPFFHEVPNARIFQRTIYHKQWLTIHTYVTGIFECLLEVFKVTAYAVVIIIFLFFHEPGLTCRVIIPEF